MNSADATTGALLYVDLDDFKPVNDELGHTVGDQVLVQTAERLQGIVRTQDMVGRIGGDEFVVCLSELNDPTEARAIAHRLYETFRDPFRIDSKEVTVTASIGGTVRLAAHDTVEDALHVADMAMYEAKEASDCAVVLHETRPGREDTTNAVNPTC